MKRYNKWQALPVQQQQGKAVESDDTELDSQVVDESQDEPQVDDPIKESESEEEDDSTDEPKEPEEEDGEKPKDSDGEEEDDGDVVVTIGDAPAPEPEPDIEAAPEWVKNLRKGYRDLKNENKELRQKLESVQNPTPKKVELGPKPKLSDDDIDYDEEVFEKRLTEWHKRKQQVDQEQADAKAAEDAQKEAWQATLQGYETKKQQLKVKDFDDAETLVAETLDQTQQGIILQGSDNSALVLYAVGKNPDKLKELSTIKDPVKFAFAVAKLEKDLKVSKRKAPPPEKKVAGTAPKSGSVDSTLERLRAEAERTGNYTKVIAYKRQKQQS